MRHLATTKLVLTGACLLLTSTVLAQGPEDASSEEADIWAVIEQQWIADEKGDKKWPDQLLADDFSGWPKDSPAPRGKISTKMWDRFADSQGKSVAHELYPLQIVIHGDVAVAHYLYTNAFEDKEGETELSNGRYSDILIRTDDGWKFLAWHGGDDE